MPLRDHDHHAGSHLKRLWPILRHDIQDGRTIQDVYDLVTFLVPLPLTFAPKTTTENSTVTVGGYMSSLADLVLPRDLRSFVANLFFNYSGGASSY
jgi:hypothetical protein